MKYLRFGILITLLFVFVSNQNPESKELRLNNQVSKDKKEIQNLIRQMLIWQDSENTIDVLPVLIRGNDSIYIFDLKQHKINLNKLRETNYFTREFIENYNQIILTLDRKMQNKEFEEWHVGELPSFIFANDVNPWCLCQDVPYDKPNPWELVEVEIIDLTSEKGELYWKWGKPELNGAVGWKAFKYRFKVSKENGKWKIVYLQGFDFRESTR